MRWLLSVYRPDSPDVLVYQEQNEYRDDGFGDVLVRQIIGTNGVSLTNTWEYYTNSAEAYRFARLKSVTRWDGFWETYNYDNLERETNCTTVYLNATNGSPNSLSRVITTSYSNSAPHFTRVEKILDQEVARTYMAFYNTSNSVKTIRATVPGASMSASGNLTNTINRNPNNLITNVYYPDGTKVFYTYVTNADKSVITTVKRGQPTAVATNILEGTKTITVVGPYGEMVSNIVMNISGGADGIILEQDAYTYGADDYARLYPTVTHLDGTTTSGTSGCCGSPNTGNTVDKDGTTTYYVEDALKRRVSTTVNNVTSSNILDAAGNLLVTMRIGTDASVITNRIAAYDIVGRIIAETNALNSPTLYTNWFDGSGQLVKQTTYADGGTRIETYYRDGQLESVKGTAVAPVRYVYGVTSEGGVQRAYSAEIKLDAFFADTSECMTNFMDLVGRTYKTAYAAASGTPSVISHWNTKGQLTNTVDADGISQLYGYNPKSQIAYTIIDSNRNYTIDYSGNDRIAFVTNDVANNGTADVRRTRTYLWMTDGSNTSNLVSTVENSVDELRSWNTVWNNGSAVTSQSRVVYDAANGYRYVTNTAPDNSYSVAITRYGTNVSSTAFDSGGAQLGQATYAYDAHGRPCKFTDARTGTTTNYFNNADQISGIVTPIPATGGASQVTTNYFDNMGRVWKTTLPDNTSVTNKYDVTGLLTNTFGSRTYPVEYTYDTQGRMKTMKTWQDFTGNNGTATTTWNYDIYRGWLTNKTYDGGVAGPVYTYTAAGRLATRAWARGTNTTYSYNYAGDLLRVDYSDSTPDVGYGYDRLGRQLMVTNATTLVCTFAYNSLGQMLSETYSSGPLSGLAITNGFDSLLRRTAVGLSNYSGTLTTYGYDNASRLATVTNGANTVSYGYLANSPLVENLTFRQGGTTRMTTVKTYDNLNRLLSITNQPSADSAIGYRYTYNSANQRTSVTNADTARWVYAYDNLGQVVSGKKYWSDGTPVTGQQFEYTFDDIGNRKGTVGGGDQYGANLRSAGYTNNTLNQLTSRGVPGYVDIQGSATNTATVTVNNQPTYRHSDYFRAELTANNSASALWFGVTNMAVLNNGTNADIVASTTGNVFVAQSPEVFSYDADGNVTNDGRWTLTWDAENRLVSIISLTNNPVESKRRLTFGYDYNGRRITKAVETWMGSTWSMTASNKFVYDGWNLLAELNATNNAVIRSYVWGLDLSGSLQGAGGVGGLLVVTDAINGAHLFAFDGNGNVAALVNASDGTVSALYEYGPFGETTRATGLMAASNPFRFSTKYQDNETDQIYYGYRFYSGSTGRWLNRDPLEEEGGVNLYGFVGNDPANTIDPLGQDFIAVGGLPVPTMPVLGIGVHMSLRYYKASCSEDPHEGVRFSPGSPPKGSQFADAVQLWTAWQSYRHFFYVRPKPTEPSQRTFVFVPISYIERASAATRLLVLYSDADNGRGSSEKGWKQIIAAASSYAYAEQADANGNVPTTLTHWPNSWYQLLGNNSNTFIRQMGKLIGRDPDAIGGGWIAGRRDPEPVSNPGWTPVYAPW